MLLDIDVHDCSGIIYSENSIIHNFLKRGYNMHDFFVVADAMAFCTTPILLIIFIVQLIRKKTAKKWGIATAVSFIMFCVFGIGGAITGCQHEWSLVNTVEATCTEDGAEVYHCALCEMDKTHKLKALGHDMVDISHRDSTTEKEGEDVRVCSRCGYEEISTIPMLECSHDWEVATCTTPKTCTKCMVTIGEALGHNWKDATLDEAKTCLRCGLTQGEPLSKDSGSEISSSYDRKSPGESTGSSDPSNSTTGNSTSTLDRNFARHSDEEAWVCAKKIVKDNLKSPSSAKFCKMKDATITHLGNGEYQVEGWVEAENSFGAKIRNNFIVNYTATSEGFKNGSVIFF